MIDTYGRWTYILDASEAEKCDMDCVADYIMQQGYTIQTDLHNLVLMVLLHYAGYLEDEAREEPSLRDEWIADIAQFVEESGGLQEFDYFP